MTVLLCIVLYSNPPVCVPVDATSPNAAARAFIAGNPDAVAHATVVWHETSQTSATVHFE